jgi:large subunit ribosomal protein L3
MKMAGHLGNRLVTVKSLRVVRSDPDKGILIVRGAVPGNEGALVKVRRSPRGKALRPSSGQAKR